MKSENILEIRFLQKSFPTREGRLPVLSIEEFQLKRGEQVVLSGPSGSGKTTLLNLMAGLLAPEKGEIWINGTSLFQISEAERDRFRLKNIGYVFQIYNLIPALSALENIQLILLFNGIQGSLQTTRAYELLEQVGLQKRAHHKPYQLSAGEQQRIAVARALAADPSLLLADEPTANLDPTNAKQILTLLRNLCRESQKTLLIVTHDLEFTEGMRILPIHSLNAEEVLKE